MIIIGLKKHLLSNPIMNMDKIWENIWIGKVKEHTEKEEGLTCCLILPWPKFWNMT